jgi:hypothetical protein
MHQRPVLQSGSANGEVQSPRKPAEERACRHQRHTEEQGRILVLQLP